MGLADDFQAIVDSLSDDWSDLELELRIFDVDRYIEAATYVVVCNAIPLSKHEWHWRILVAHRFGHAAAEPAVRATLRMLDEARIGGELALREVRIGRAPVTQMWGRPESARREFRRIHAQ
jgi:hypothetical protein